MNNLRPTARAQRFSVDLFPDVIREVNAIVKQVTAVAGSFKSEILISFLKDHCINTAWLAGNTELVELITSRSLEISHTEKLFEAVRGNKTFLEDFEDYIRQAIRYSETVSTPEMRAGDPEVLWEVQKLKLLSQFAHLHADDFRYDYGKKEVMMTNLQYKLGKSREELDVMLARL